MEMFLDTLTYTTRLGLVNAMPLRGKYLGRSIRTKKDAAFFGADLYRGEKRLVEPSLAQAASITGSDISAVWWALHREEYRSAILYGELPLVPSRQRQAPALVPVPKVEDAGLVAVIRDLVGRIGVDRLLTVMSAIEVQAHH
jgi:hypothetical protein